VLNPWSLYLAFEKVWQSATQSLTANGTINGIITVSDTAGFYKEQMCLLQASSQSNLTVVIIEVLSSSQISVGNSTGSGSSLVVDVSAFGPGNAATISAFQQPQPSIKPNDIMQYVYEHAPKVAIRTFSVDSYGNGYTQKNPIPVTLVAGIIPEFVLRITEYDNDPNPGDIHSSVRVGNGVNDLNVNSDGSINVNVINSITGTAVSQYFEVDGVALGGSVTVFTYTVPLGMTLYLDRIDFSSDSVSEFDFSIGGSLNKKRRLTWTHFNDTFEYTLGGSGYPIATGTVLLLTATNFSVNNLATFNATLQGTLQ
jgi:hypothetical protein